MPDERVKDVFGFDSDHLGHLWERAVAEHVGQLGGHRYKAKAHLLDKYPEHVVAERVHDLDQVAALADRVQALAAQAQRTGDVRDLVQGVRDLSQAVNEYSDKYAGWRDFSKGGEQAVPGWRDLHGVDPLESVEMATRVVSIDRAPTGSM